MNFYSDIENIKDEEQDYFDNMPENMQGGEKGSRAEEVVSYLENAVSYLETAIDDINSASK